eukprot:TRINITY_DN6843_c0_g1_i1.p1 TRINITY_DN6843_c0_g1~~TRINITY_DN6843_c0_g1_i1.p1  ORF type:complete len:331 (-),score=26.19 TRINITY_DN6843_c0_g1_i1:66-1058(-)
MFDPVSELLVAGSVAALVAAVIAVVMHKLTYNMDLITGGVIGSIPSTIVPATLAVMMVETRIDVVGSLYAVPSGILLNAIFLTIWKFLPPSLGRRRCPIAFNLIITITLSITMWVAMAVLLFHLLSDTTLVGKRYFAGVVTLIMLLFGILMAFWQPIPCFQAVPKQLDRVTYLTFALLTFMSIGTSVAISLWSEVAAGLAACFPCFILVDMISYWFYQGTPSSGKQMVAYDTNSYALYVPHIILGSLSASSYCTLFALTAELELYIHLEETWLAYFGAVFLACIISFLLAVLCVSVPVLLFLKRLQWRAMQRLSSIPDLPSEDAPLFQPF